MEFSRQPHNAGMADDAVLERYIRIAEGYAEVLNRTAGIKILSPQETSVLKLIDEGNRSKGIADILGISLHTVSRHRQNIIAKLKVRSSAEACKVARNLSIL